ncbi:MAG: NfeD family protein [Elusimicrobia bacterium]|nr:NfeD family protein [Elusimicrobiota bacterium]
MDWYFWLVSAITFAAFEIVTPGLFFFFLAVGSVAAFLISLFGVPVWLEFLIFAVVAVSSIYLLRPIIKKYMYKAGTISSNVDELIGKTGTVTEVVQDKVLAKISGEVWTVISENTLTTGDKVTVKQVQSNTLIVDKIKSS